MRRKYKLLPSKGIMGIVKGRFKDYIIVIQGSIMTATDSTTGYSITGGRKAVAKLIDDSYLVEGGL